MESGDKCSGCHKKKSGIRLMRGTRFVVPMCDDCSLSMPIVNGDGREVRVIAVATEAFARAAAN